MNWVTDETDSDVTVTVREGEGRFNSENFYTDRTGRAAGHALVAAHEAGHWLGLYDEYVADTAPWYPLYDSANAADPFLDFFELYTLPGEEARSDWRELAAPADQSGLMGRNGPIRERYFLSILDWFRQASGRPDVVLGMEASFVNREPLLELPDDVQDPVLVVDPVPEPGTLALLVAGLIGLAFVRRKKAL